MNGLNGAGFSIKAVKEPMPSDDMLKSVPEMKDENRRTMFFNDLSSKGTENNEVNEEKAFLRKWGRLFIYYQNFQCN